MWSSLGWFSSHFPGWYKVGKADYEVSFQKCLGIKYSPHSLRFSFLQSKITTPELLFWSPHSDKLLKFILFLILLEKAAIKNATFSKQNIHSLKILLFFSFFFNKMLFISLASCPKIRTKLQPLLWLASMIEELKIFQQNKVVWNIKKLNLPADLFILKWREKTMTHCLSQPAVKLFFISCQCTEFCG